MPLEVAAAWIVSALLVLTLLAGLIVTGVVLVSRMHPETQRILRYAAVGSVATGTYFVLALVLNTWGWRPVVAATTAQIVSTLLSYFGHQWITFEGTTTHTRAAPRFLVAALLAFVLNIATTHLLAHVLNASSLVTVSGTTIVVTLGGYIIMRLWVFVRS